MVTEEIKLKGTIVITDPCYIINKEDEDENLDEWHFCNYGQDMWKLLHTHDYMCKRTIYGDWSCTCWIGEKLPELEYIFDEAAENAFQAWKTSKNNEERDKNYNKWIIEKNRVLNDIIYGQFCADAGQVIVAKLDDILSYNPNFAEWQKKHDWCATIIDDFDGIVKYEVEEKDSTIRKGEKYKFCYLKGEGNKPFITEMTNF